MIAEIRDYHARAHIRFDWVFAENSWGFHNSREADVLLEEGHQYADWTLEILAEE
ncbi:MAG: ammonia-forming cytochrome c nitrite reductase subunit c552 [Candidatus Syntrophonatronum acetioxidans]|uniref:Ammonia-forming cytochrome c nitrite reductase subunit c552 n=1 Tax=Candidatus Syntrophonatronum acetioxidans TaxID=1795816 RepID=A0A424Y9L5_9FIRM|nr:MAG: ammonia-forming cytochrome c nitrite reductase subunit c552 [Candidatus Syntrophonatronum acetioxidans]